jgi:protein arginine kinase activator
MFYSFLAGETEHKVELCADCPKLKVVQEPGAHNVIQQLLPNVVIEQPSEAAPAKPKVETCPVCGFSIEDLERTKRMGCARCYEVFSRPVGRFVRAVQRGYKHIGKICLTSQSAESLEDRLTDLQSRLDDAISKEAFESAASLRDEIRRIVEAQDKISN